MRLTNVDVFELPNGDPSVGGGSVPVSSPRFANAFLLAVMSHGIGHAPMEPLSPRSYHLPRIGQ